MRKSTITEKELKKEQFNLDLRAIGKKIQLIGKYENANTKTTFRCQCGFQWEATPGNVKFKSGCPSCAKVSVEEFDRRLLATGKNIHRVSKYHDSITKITFECEYGHQWDANPSLVLCKTGCPECDRIQRKMKVEDIAEILRPRGITLLSEYHKENSKGIFECEEGHKWEAYVGSVIHRSGCPTCADYGFDPTKQAWEYGFIRDGYLKIGITNNLTRRLNEHRRYGEFELVHERYHPVGQLALDWERNIKQTHVGRFVSKEICPDGWTETFPISLLEVIL